MNVYLLRHGIAADRDEVKYPNDNERPLTKDGMEKMREEGRGIAGLIDAPDVILTSPLVRAKQTAQILAKALACEERLETSEALRPGADVAAVRELLADLAPDGVESILLVGHEPDFGEIASGLIGAKGSVVEFKKGSICAIHLDDEHLDEPGTLLWHATPRHLRAIGGGME